MARYILINEDTEPDDGCEIVFHCDKPCTVAIVDTNDTTDQEYPEGFHVAHTCEKHGREFVERFNA